MVSQKHGRGSEVERTEEEGVLACWAIGHVATGLLVLGGEQQGVIEQGGR